MELDHTFEVPVGVDRAWSTLLDLEQVAPCFPGAALDQVDGDVHHGSVKVRLGPVRLSYAGQARVVERDETAHRAVIEAKGSATGAASTAAMTVTATARALAPERTQVQLHTALAITGRPAQFGRGVLEDVGTRLIDQFGTQLSTQLFAPSPVASPTGPGSSTARVSTLNAAAPPAALDLASLVDLSPVRRALPAAAAFVVVLGLDLLLRRRTRSGPAREGRR